MLQNQFQPAPLFESSNWENYLRRDIAKVGRELQTPASPLGIPVVNIEGRLESQARTFGDTVAEFGDVLAAWSATGTAAQQETAVLLDSGQLTP